jgi:hypothetical protein
MAKRDLLAVVVTDGRLDRTRLELELEEFTGKITWEDIKSETHQPAIGT